MDIKINRIFDEIDTRIDHKFSETEGINQMKFKRDSLIKLTIFKKKKKKKRYNSQPKYSININNFSNNSGSKSSRSKNEFKNILKLINEINKSKREPILKLKGKLKLTPFQKIINEINENKKRVDEMIERNNSPSKLNLILKNYSRKLLKTDKEEKEENKNNTNFIFKTPKKSRGVISKINSLTYHTVNYSPEYSYNNNKTLKFCLSNSKPENLKKTFIMNKNSKKSSLINTQMNTINLNNEKLKILNFINSHSHREKIYKY